MRKALAFDHDAIMVLVYVVFAIYSVGLQFVTCILDFGFRYL